MNKIIEHGNVDSMSGHDFNDYCAELLRLNKFENVTTTSKTGDKGADIICTKQGKKYAIQCKRHNSNIGFNAIQEIYTAKDIYACDIAVVLTNSKFTKSAKAGAKTLNVKLWGREKLNQLQKVIVRNEKDISSEKAENFTVTTEKPNLISSIFASCVLIALLIGVIIVLYGLWETSRLDMPSFTPYVIELLFDNVVVVIIWAFILVYSWVIRKWDIFIITAVISLIALYVGLS